MSQSSTVRTVVVRRAGCPLIAGIAAPLLVVPLMWLWLGKKLTPEQMADSVLRVIAIGCRNQSEPTP